jgi:hypothetical protein
MDGNKLQNTQNLETLLGKLDTEFSERLIRSGAIEEDEAKILHRLQSLYTEIRREKEEDRHLTISELRSLTRERKRLGADWNMPDHLSNCDACLEAFQILLDGVPAVDTQMFHAVVDDKITRTFPIGAEASGNRSEVRRWTIWLSFVFGSIFLVGLAAIVLSPSVRLFVESGSVLANGGWRQGAVRIGAGVPLMSGMEGVWVNLPGGSQLKIAPNSHWAFERATIFSTCLRIRLYGGAIEAFSPDSGSGALLEFEFPMATVSFEDADVAFECLGMPGVLTPSGRSEDAGEDGTNPDNPLADPLDSVVVRVIRGYATCISRNERRSIKVGQALRIRHDGTFMIQEPDSR